MARDANDENEGWKIKLLIFVGRTSGSVNVKTFNDNLQELQVIESKWNAIRKGLAFELLNAQEAFLCSYFAQLRRGATAKSKYAMEWRHSKDWAILNDKLICVTKRKVIMQRGEIMWKRHWQNEDGAWEKVRVWQP